MTPAGLLALSGERDQWESLALAWSRSAYAAGHRAGYEAGYKRGFERAVRDWKVAAGTIGGGPSFAELDRRRYPPGGRQSWIIPRPGDADGEKHG